MVRARPRCLGRVRSSARDPAPRRALAPVGRDAARAATGERPWSAGYRSAPEESRGRGARCRARPRAARAARRRSPAARAAASRRQRECRSS